jgi:hypothetical protein
MIFRLVLICIFLIPGISHADETDELITIVDKYISSITCVDHINVDDLCVFKMSSREAISDAYAVVWSGDKGCYGGSGTSSAFVTPVVITQSGRLVVAREGELRIEAREYTSCGQIEQNLIYVLVPKYEENDANCCPSGKEYFFFTYDDVEQKISRVQL